MNRKEFLGKIGLVGAGLILIPKIFIASRVHNPYDLYYDPSKIQSGDTVFAGPLTSDHAQKYINNGETVKNKTFLLTKPLTMNNKRAGFYNCLFLFYRDKNFDGDYLILDQGGGTLHNCALTDIEDVHLT